MGRLDLFVIHQMGISLAILVVDKADGISRAGNGRRRWFSSLDQGIVWAPR
jgi:hypothetical protein